MYGDRKEDSEMNEDRYRQMDPALENKIQQIRQGKSSQHESNKASSLQ